MSMRMMMQADHAPLFRAKAGRGQAGCEDEGSKPDIVIPATGGNLFPGLRGVSALAAERVHGRSRLTAPVARWIPAVAGMTREDVESAVLTSPLLVIFLKKVRPTYPRHFPGPYPVSALPV